MGAWLYNSMIEWLAERVQGMLSGLVSLLTASVFTSPDVTVFPQVQLLVERSSEVVNAVFVLAIIAAGAIGMTHGTLQIRYQVKDLVPRLVVGFIAANFGVSLCAKLIEVANAVTAAMAGETASGPRVIEFVKARILSAMTDPAAAVLAVIVGLIIVVLCYLLMISWFGRIVALIVLAGIAPAALACCALPQTLPAAQLWWRSLLGCLATPLLQALFFSTSVDLLLDPEHNVPILLGIGPAPATDVFNLFIAAGLLWLTVRIPRLLGRYVMRAGQMSTAGVILRTVVVQSVTRRLRLP
jgi:hypothetical protein